MSGTPHIEEVAESDGTRGTDDIPLENKSDMPRKIRVDPHATGDPSEAAKGEAITISATDSEQTICFSPEINSSVVTDHPAENNFSLERHRSVAQFHVLGMRPTLLVVSPARKS